MKYNSLLDYKDFQEMALQEYYKIKAEKK